MKKVAIIICTLVLPVWIFAQNRSINNFYEKYEGQEGVTSLNISGSLLHMLFQGDKDEETRREVNKLTGLRLIAAEKKNHQIQRSDIQTLRNSLEKDRYEELMQIRDGATLVNFVVQEERGKITELVMLVDDPKDFLIISFSGEIDPKKLEKTFEDVEIDGGHYFQKLDNY